MTKNIIVVDETGKRYGTTYLKRAKGLVKQGRARFLARDMLCLACPPEQDQEDKRMSGQTLEDRTDRCSMDYCLEQIEQIAHQTAYLDQVISELRQIADDEAGSHKAKALRDVVRSREETNRQMLHFYEKMYDDLKEPALIDATARRAGLQEQLLKIMEKTLENGNLSAGEVQDLFNGAWDAIRHVDDRA